MGTKNNPGKFDCYNAAEPDEPTFTLLGRDPAAAATVRAWVGITVRSAKGLSREKMLEALACADAMEEYCKERGGKPDNGDEFKRGFRVALDLMVGRELETIISSYSATTNTGPLSWFENLRRKFQDASARLRNEFL